MKLSTPAWPTMRGNSRNTGCIIHSADIGQRKIIKVDTCAETKLLSLINATPVIDASERIYVGSSSNYFFVIDQQGATQSFPIGGISDSAGCFVAPDTVYFSSGDYSLYSVTNGVALKHHAITKTVTTPSSIKWFEGNVVADQSGRLFAGCDDFNLYCFAEAGAELKLVWTFPTGLFIWSACAFSDDGSTAYFISADMKCYALDITSPQACKLRWSQPVDNICASSPVVTATGDVIFGDFSGALRCFDGKSGAKKWTLPFDTLIYASVGLVDEDHTLFVVASDGQIRAYDLSSGTPQEKWRRFTGMPSFSSPSIGRDPEGRAAYLVYVATGDGNIYAFDPAGDRRWCFDTTTFGLGADAAAVDPAFSNLIRYPSINSSIALGHGGIATATSSGQVYYLPYDAYLREPEHFSKVVEPTGLAGGDEPALSYISPAGRMARTRMRGAGATPLVVARDQLISFACIAAQRDGDAGFAALSDEVAVLLDGEPYDAFVVSSDRTQIHVRAPDSSADRFMLSITDGSRPPNQVQCEFGAIHDPASASDLTTFEFIVQQMSFFSPFIVPALDQLGIATINLNLVFVDVHGPAENATVVAYGYESYDSGIRDSPTRNVVYLFTGTCRNDSFSLKAENSYFELTAAPMVVDRIRITGVAAADGAGSGGSISVEYEDSWFNKHRWLMTFVLHWFVKPALGKRAQSHRPFWATPLADNPVQAGVIRQIWLLVCRLAQDVVRWVVEFNESKLLSMLSSPTAYWRLTTFLFRMLSYNIFASWQLFDRSHRMFWVGNYALRQVPRDEAVELDCAFYYNHRAGRIGVRLRGATADRIPIVAVLLFCETGAGLGEPIKLDYTRFGYSEVLADGTLLYYLALKGKALASIARGTRMQAQVMADLHPAGRYSLAWREPGTGPVGTTDKASRRPAASA